MPVNAQAPPQRHVRREDALSLADKPRQKIVRVVAGSLWLAKLYVCMLYAASFAFSANHTLIRVSVDMPCL